MKKAWAAVLMTLVLPMTWGCSPKPSVQQAVEKASPSELLIGGANDALPPGLSVSPMELRELSQGGEGSAQSSRPECVAPVNRWMDKNASRAGETVEALGDGLPSTRVIVAIIVGKGNTNLDVVRFYVEECGEFTRRGPGVRMKVTVAVLPMPESDADDAYGFRETIRVVGEKNPINTTYYFAETNNGQGIGVSMALRSQLPEPSPLQIQSLNGLYKAQVSKVAGTGSQRS